MANYTPPFLEEVDDRLKKKEEKATKRFFTRKKRGALLMALLVGALLSTAFIPTPEGDEQNVATTPSTTATTDQGAADGEVACDGWEIDRDDNVQNRVISEGLNGASEEAVDEAFEAARHDERILLYLWGYTPQGSQQAVQADTLVSDGCMSEKGIGLWHQAKGAWDAASVSDAVAPRHACNTGMTEKGPVRARHCGISGDRSAAHVVFKDGTEVWILYRCGNVATPDKPVLPEGPTDEEEPTTTTRPPRNTSTTSPPAVQPAPSSSSTTTTSSSTTTTTSSTGTTTTTTYEDCSDCDEGPYPPPEEEPDDPEERENPEEDEEAEPSQPPPPDEDEDDPDEELPR